MDDDKVSLYPYFINKFVKFVLADSDKLETIQMEQRTFLTTLQAWEIFYGSVILMYDCSVYGVTLKRLAHSRSAVPSGGTRMFKAGQNT